MHKKVLSIGIVAMLLLTTVMLAIPTRAKVIPPGKEYTVYTKPPTVNGTAVGLGNTFVVELWANTSLFAGGPPPGCFAYAYWFQWNDTLLKLESWSVFPPVDKWTLGIFTGDDSLKDVNPNNGKNDTHSYGVSALGVPAAWMDDRKIASYTFRVMYEPVPPEPTMSCNLHIVDKGFADVNGANRPPGDLEDGLYTIYVGAIKKPHLEVKDTRDEDHTIERCDFPLDSKFNVTIGIKMLHTALNLRAWEVKLKFDTTLLNVSTVYNGTFLELFAPMGVYYVNVTYEDLGYVHIAGTMLGSPTSEPGTSPPMPSGPAEGDLAFVEFLVTNVSVAPAMYQCDIGLYDIKLVNSTDQPILYDPAVNLTYYACYTTLGWYLDCTTDSFRKKCETPWVGKGPNVTADAYEPQDLVILYAYLEYNQEPEAYKMVTFEIHGPVNSVENITIFRTAWTNDSGIATINFTIPGSGLPNWYEMVHGKWTCYQAAQVKIYQKPTDWLWFEVGWIVEILNVTVGVPHPEGVEKNEWINITIWYKNIMMIEKWVLFTITVLDELLDPIQTETKGIWVDPATYAHNPIPTYGFIVIDSLIPDYAHVGLATVYVNAFTDLPMNCGCPYCPEVTATFWIIKTGSGT